MRAGILVLGPLIAKYQKSIISLPGGCLIGARPVNYHLNTLEKLGMKAISEAFADRAYEKDGSLQNSPPHGPRGRRAARQPREEEGVPGVARVDAEGQTQTPFRSRVFYSAYLTPYIHYIERQTPLYPLYKERNALIHYIERQTPSYE